MSIIARFKIDRGDFCLDVKATLPGHGISAIFGPSGSGKTTLLRAIAGLEKAPQGFLEVEGELWQNENTFIPPHLRAIGYVFQEANLFAHLNVRRNIEYGRRRVPAKDHKLPLHKVIKLLGIEHLLKRHPHQLSGGEQQRVAIARALATSPSVLLMDEPLASLDSARKEELLPYFESLNQELDIPILYVSHSKKEVLRLADHILLLDKGEISAEGPTLEVLSRRDLSLLNDSDAQSIIESVVVRHDNTFSLSSLEFSGGEFLIEKQGFDIGKKVRLLIHATDVSITIEHAKNTSIMNIFPATILEISERGTSEMIVRLAINGIDTSIIVAKITRKSAEMLQLVVGKDVFAQIKSVALLN